MNWVGPVGKLETIAALDWGGTLGCALGRSPERAHFGIGSTNLRLNLGEFPANESRPMSQRQGEEGGILNIRGGGACRLRISCTVNDFHVEDNNQNIDEVTKQGILSCWKFARSPSFPLFIFPLHRLIVSNVSFVIGCP